MSGWRTRLLPAEFPGTAIVVQHAHTTSEGAGAMADRRGFAIVAAFEGCAMTDAVVR